MPYTPVGDQIHIVEGDGSALVLAGPGRGKTVTALAAANRWLDKNPRSQALFTSFSNAAVRRLATASGLVAAARVEFRTVHSVAMEVLKAYGRFVGLRAPARALDRMEERLVAMEQGWSQGTEHKANLEEYARATGRVPFSLMVPWATALLQSSDTLRRAVASRYGLIVIDEFQDVDATLWAFLKVLGADCRVLALGDENQMIYGAAFDATLRRFSAFEDWKGIERTRLSMPSFRCANQEILAFADALLTGGRFNGPNSAALKLLPVFRQNQVRARLAMIWAKFRAAKDTGSRLAFLVPSARKAERLLDELEAPEKGQKIPIPIRPRVERDDSRRDAFALAVYAANDVARLGLAATTRRQVAVALSTIVALTTRSTLEAAEVEKLLGEKSRAACPVRDFLVRSAGQADDVGTTETGLLEAMAGDKRFAVAAASLRRERLPPVRPCEPIEGSMFDAYRAARQPRMDGEAESLSRTNMLSMHRCKGREFDYVVMIVDPHAHKADADIGELRRLHYVAATRARRALAVVYVDSNAGSVLGPVLGK